MWESGLKMMWKAGLGKFTFTLSFLRLTYRRYIGLHGYIEQFKKSHVNGKVLLTLQESDLAGLSMKSTLHQRKFLAAMANLCMNTQHLTFATMLL
jgi:SAM domain (Sterile alpha motif)